MKYGSLKWNRVDIYFVHMLLLFLGISHYFGITFLNIAITVLIGFVLIFSENFEKRIVILFTLLPFFNLFTTEIGNTSLYYLFLIFVLFSVIKKNNWKIKKGKIWLVLCGIIITLFWRDIVVQIKWILVFSFLCIMTDNSQLEKSMPMLIKHISISTIVASVIGYLMMIMDKSIYNNSIVYLSGKTITRFAGLIGDSVFYSQFCVILIACILAFCIMHKLSIRFSIFTSIILSGFVLITYSKTGIILLVFTFICYALVYIKNNLKNNTTVIKAIFFSIVFLIVTILTVNYIVKHQNTDLIKSFMLRFSAKDLWTGRNSVSESYFEKLNSSIIYMLHGMSISMYTSNGAVVGATMITRAHNIYLETLCLFGVLPAIFIGILAVKKIYNIVRKKRNFLCQIIPTVVLLLSGISLHGHIEWPYYFLVLLCYSTLGYVEKEEWF